MEHKMESSQVLTYLLTNFTLKPSVPGSGRLWSRILAIYFCMVENLSAYSDPNLSVLSSRLQSPIHNVLFCYSHMHTARALTRIYFLNINLTMCRMLTLLFWHVNVWRHHELVGSGWHLWVGAGSPIWSRKYANTEIPKISNLLYNTGERDWKVEDNLDKNEESGL